MTEKRRYFWIVEASKAHGEDWEIVHTYTDGRFTVLSWRTRRAAEEHAQQLRETGAARETRIRKLTMFE